MAFFVFNFVGMKKEESRKRCRRMWPWHHRERGHCVGLFCMPGRANVVNYQFSCVLSVSEKRRKKTQRMENVMKWVNVDAERFSEWKWSFYVCAPRSHSLWQMILMCVILVTFDYRQNIRAKLLSLDQQIAEFYVGFACEEYGGNYETIDDISVGHTNWPIRMMSRIAPNAHRMAAHTDHKIQK